MKTVVVFLTMIVLLISSACTRDLSTEPEKSTMRALTLNEKQIANASDEFGLDLFQKVVADEKNANIFISPLSVSMALGMTLNGANGATEQAMQTTLGFGSLSADEINSAYQSLIQLLTTIDPKVRFEIANSIWSHSDFYVEPDFITTNKTWFDAVVRTLDFHSPSALKTINAWVDEKTHGKINKILDELDPMDRMVLINAIYFKGTWTYEFDKAATKEETFFVTDEHRVQAPFMRQTNENFSYFDNDLMQAIDLPYGNGQFRMTILSPRHNKTVDDIMAELNTSNWSTWMGSFTEQKGTLEMPKFTLEYKKSLPQILSAMGMGVAFTDRADFTGINKNGGLYISDVIHKTFVDVYEEGTEAAAVTAVVISLTSVGDGDQEFYMRVDRPFLFSIREKSSGTILFIGTVNNPE